MQILGDAMELLLFAELAGAAVVVVLLVASAALYFRLRRNTQQLK